jgi:hypothetical protein
MHIELLGVTRREEQSVTGRLHATAQISDNFVVAISIRASETHMKSK